MNMPMLSMGGMNTMSAATHAFRARDRIRDRGRGQIRSQAPARARGNIGIRNAANTANEANLANIAGTNTRITRVTSGSTGMSKMSTGMRPSGTARVHLATLAAQAYLARLAP